MAKILPCECEFGHGEGVDEFGFAVVRHIAEEYISLWFECHDTSAGIGFAGGKADDLAEILDDDIFGEKKGAEERCVDWCDLFGGGETGGGDRSVLPVAESGGGVVVDVDIVTGDVVSTDMEMIDDVLFHGKKW